MKDNNLETQSPYAKVLKQRGKISNTIQNDKAIDMSKIQSKKCSKCHEHTAQPKQFEGIWYYTCYYPLCAYREEISIQVVEQFKLQSKGEIVPEHGATSSNEPLCYGSFDRRSKKWTGRKNTLDNDDGLSAVFGSGAVKVSETTSIYSDGKWNQQ